MNCCLRLAILAYKFTYRVYKWFYPTVYEKVPSHVSAAKLPWMFVGVELTDGTILDKTEDAQKLVDGDYPISPLTILAGIDETTVKRCFYLDAETLKEEEIPANGITINDSRFRGSH